MHQAARCVGSRLLRELIDTINVPNNLWTAQLELDCKLPVNTPLFRGYRYLSADPAVSPRV